MIRREMTIYKIIENAAIRSERCPTNAEIAKIVSDVPNVRNLSKTSIPAFVMKLVEDGLITVRVFGQNWRDVTMLTGKNIGKKTLPPPHGGKAYIVIDQAERSRRDKKRRW